MAPRDSLLGLKGWLHLDNRQIAVVASGLVFISLVVLGWFTSLTFESDQKAKVEAELRGLAVRAARTLSAEEHRALRQYGDGESAAYIRGNQSLRTILQANPELKYIYTLYRSGDQLKFGLDPAQPGDFDRDGRQDKSYLGEVYKDATPDVIKSLTQGVVVSEPVPHTDEWGTFMSAYAPIFLANGEVEAVVGVDVTDTAYLKAISVSNRFKASWLCGSVLISAIVGLITLRITNRVHERFLMLFEAQNVLESSNEKLTELNKQLDLQTRTDALTGLLSRTGFCHEVERCLNAIEESDEPPCAMALLDIDGFKIVNDHYGHAYGDRLLVSLAEELGDHLPDATIGRLGGDEFILLMQGEDARDRLEIGLRGLGVVLSECPLMVGLASQYCTVSAGVVQYRPGDTGMDMLRRADIAMYAAKKAGAGQVLRYEDDMGSALDRRVELEHELRVGWEQREFWMAIQPIVDLEKGRVIAGELLIRWTRADGKTVSPAEFIPVAEEIGLVSEMGLFAVEEACRYLEQIQREFPGREIHLSVNISPRQVNEPDFVERIEAILDRYSFHKGGLWLELTESSLMREGDDVLAKLNRLRELGVRIALDDFGTGYSSLSMLLDIPLDCLKIDRSFVMRMRDENRSIEVVRMILALSELLGLDVVAEGIESHEEGELLRSMGCRWGQGFHYSRPIPMSDFVDRCGEYKKAA